MPANKYSDSLLMDALRGSLSNAESFGRGFAVAPVGLLGDINALAREYITPRLPANVQGLLQSMPSAPTTESILSAIPRMTPRRMETAGMEQIGSAANPRGPINLGRAVASLPSDVTKAGQEFLAAGQPARVVPPSIAREGNPIQSAVVLIGDKIFTGRTHGDALNRAVYEGVVRKEGGKYIYPKGAEVNSDLFMTNSGQIIDRLQASKMFDIGASETAIEKGLMQSKPSGSMTIDQYMEQAQAIKKQREQPSFQYPQQAALDLAQQRAALPVSEGGLGLPANNTPMDRAKAMGFGTEAYHGTNANVPVFDISKNITAKDIYSSPNPSEASAYATSEGGNVMPLLLRGEVKDLTKESQYVDNQLRKAYNAQVSKYERQYYPFEQFKESFMRGQLYQDTGGQSAQNALVGELIGNRKSILKIPDAVSDFGVGESYVTQNPANIRSRFAAFDPFRKDVATATAMGVALPDLLAAEYNQQPQSAGLLYPLP